MYGRFPSHLILSHSDSCTNDKCVEGCPVRLMDEQSGQSTSKKLKTRGNTSTTDVIYGKYAQRSLVSHNDQGGASRYFQNFDVNDDQEQQIDPFLYAAKASKRERNAGCDNSNNHPTVKSQALMRYLVKLITPEYGTCLDPFMGSGSTIVAAVTEGFDYIGIEKEADYFLIAQARIAHAHKVSNDKNK